MKLIELGTDYGSHIIPDGLLNENSVVYSFGAGEDISFDIELVKNYETKINLFDPTPRSIDYCKPTIQSQNLTDFISFYPYGLSDKDESCMFYGPDNPRNVSHSMIYGLKTKSGFSADCKSLSSIMNMLSHSHLNLLKLDIVGGEYKVIENLISEKLSIDCITLEFHNRSSVLDFTNEIKKAKDSLISFGYNMLSDKLNHCLFLK